MQETVTDYWKLQITYQRLNLLVQLDNPANPLLLTAQLTSGLYDLQSAIPQIVRPSCSPIVFLCRAIVMHRNRDK